MRRGGRSKRRLVLATLGIVGALVFGGCEWPMLGGNPALTASSPDQAINSGNVSTLQPLFATAGSFGSPVEVFGVVYAVGATSSGNALEAFDANGVTNCSGTPNQCTPLWTAPVSGSTTGAPAVVNGVVYVFTSLGGAGTLYAFDAKGVTNCSGTPTVCQPLWTTVAAEGTGLTSPMVANGEVYVGGDAFDANGVTNCSGTPKVCQPLWTVTLSVDVLDNTPAFANGVVYYTGGPTPSGGGVGQLYAFSADGTTNCSGTPTTCSPLWTATMPNGVSSPAVSGGFVFAESGNGLFAFDANGVTNCSGTPTTCSPLWTATLVGSPQALSLAVANGIVYVPSVGSGMQAFDANGVTNCSGTPKTCAPLWSYSVGGFGGSPSVANGLVFIGGGGGSGNDLEAFDANGVTNCSGTPKVCTPLWSGVTGTPLVNSVAIANGKVYLSDIPNFELGSDSHLYAWVLPPPNTEIVLPKNKANIKGTQVLSAGSSPGVTSLQFEISGGPSNVHDQDIGTTADPTIYGWLSSWDTTTVPNGTYTLQSVASYGGEVSGTSAPITITVNN
jgi:hypothetical protein